MRIFCFLAVALTLGACQSISVQNVDDAIRHQLPLACALVDGSHSAFVAIEAVHPLKASIVTAEETAYQGAAAICAHPDQVTTMALVIEVTRDATAIALQLREAQKAGG